MIYFWGLKVFKISPKHAKWIWVAIVCVCVSGWKFLGRTPKTIVAIFFPARAAYWAFRYDGKARVECNLFERYYNCTYIRESCLAQRRTNNSDPNMWYCDFRVCSPRHLTKIDDSTYRQTCRFISPYHCIPGWRLETCLRDILHVVYLGTAKDLVPSILADWLDHNLLGGPRVNLDHKLRYFSLEMFKVFHDEWFPGQIEVDVLIP